MIPPFHSAVDAACSYLDPNGYMAVTDFYVSAKHDLPLRQMNWMKRFFWRATFDLDGIDLGPERRDYLEHKLTRVYEYNSEVTLTMRNDFVRFVDFFFLIFFGAYLAATKMCSGLNPNSRAP